MVDILNAYDRFPESRYMGSFSVEIFSGTGLTVEYLHDEFEDEADVLTAQLAVEF